MALCPGRWIVTWPDGVTMSNFDPREPTLNVEQHIIVTCLGTGAERPRKRSRKAPGKPVAARKGKRSSRRRS